MSIKAGQNILAGIDVKSKNTVIACGNTLLFITSSLEFFHTASKISRIIEITLQAMEVQI